MREIKARGVPADPNRAKLRATLKDWVGPSWFGVVGLVFRHRPDPQLSENATPASKSATRMMV